MRLRIQGEEAQERLGGRLAAHLPVFQQITQDLGKVRLARPEKARDPSPHVIGLASPGLGVLLQELDQQLFDRVRHHVLFQLLPDIPEIQIVHFDDGYDVTGNRIDKEVLNLGH